MEGLRKLPFIVGLALIVLALLVEIGGTGLIKGTPVNPAVFEQKVSGTQAFLDATKGLTGDQQNQLLGTMSSAANQKGRPPGLGIPSLGLLDAILVFTIALVGIGLVMPERLQGKVQGVVTLIFSIIVILLGIGLIFGALALLILMISLLLSVPFGTLVYLIVWGFFNTGGASAALALIMALKILFVIALIIAQQRFLQNKGLVLLVLTSLVASIIVSFLHGIVPFFLVSITDAVAAIIVGILAVIWAVVLLVGAIISVGMAVVTR
ncbi:MAG TPA: hypothetical protein VET24_10685 [Actinomycetota bacterium]|nr:hypothetical protein [Actinomycetota bacterium]